MTDIERFWDRVDHSAGPAACWPWTGALTSRGYGAVQIDGRQIPTHRLALSLALSRPLSVGMEACHRCDNRPCCNPAHLFEGSRTTNTQDARAKGRLATGSRHGRHTQPHRTARGEHNGWARLTSPAVLEIRRRLDRGEHQRSIAAAFGIAQTTVSSIARRRTWAALAEPGVNECADGVQQPGHGRAA